MFWNKERIFFGKEKSVAPVSNTVNNHSDLVTSEIQIAEYCMGTKVKQFQVRASSYTTSESLEMIKVLVDTGKKINKTEFESRQT